MDLTSMLERLEKQPVDDYCPLLNIPNWRCGQFKKGEELQCKTLGGYIKCARYKIWFWNGVQREAAKLLFLATEESDLDAIIEKFKNEGIGVFLEKVKKDMVAHIVAKRKK